ncbi:integrase, catalytic region, zinc finger, CCHC-type containing protein [Tanacetum coccineum]
MTTLITTTTNNSQMHNDIMAASSRDCPPMLAPGRYAQWQSRFMRYVNTKPNNKELRLCILKGPYAMTEIDVPAKPATETKEAVPTQNVPETYKNTCPENHAYFDAKAGAIHMILSRIRDDVYSTVDACTTAKREWSRFVTVVKQTQVLDTESYHKLFDILKQYHNEVNEIRAEKMTRNANPLALVAPAQHYP